MKQIKLNKAQILSIIEPLINNEWQTLKDIQRNTKPKLSVGCISMTIHKKLSNKVECDVYHTGINDWQQTQIFRLKH